VNDAADKYPRKHAAAPIGAERGLQPRRYFIHAIARCQLASDLEPRVSHGQYAPSRLDEPGSAEKDIGSPKGWILVNAKLSHACGPCLGFKQRHLATAAPIHTARDTLSRH